MHDTSTQAVLLGLQLGRTLGRTVHPSRLRSQPQRYRSSSLPARPALNSRIHAPAARTLLPLPSPLPSRTGRTPHSAPRVALTPAHRCLGPSISRVHKSLSLGPSRSTPSPSSLARSPSGSHAALLPQTLTPAPHHMPAPHPVPSQPAQSPSPLPSFVSSSASHAPLRAPRPYLPFSHRTPTLTRPDRRSPARGVQAAAIAPQAHQPRPAPRHTQPAPPRTPRNRPATHAGSGVPAHWLDPSRAGASELVSWQRPGAGAGSPTAFRAGSTASSPGPAPSRPKPHPSEGLQRVIGKDCWGGGGPEGGGGA